MLWRLSVVKLYAQVKFVIDELVGLERSVWVENDRHSFIVLVKLINIDFSAELDNMAESHVLLSIPHEKGLGDKTCVLIEDLWFKQTMEAGMLFRFEIPTRLKMIRVRIVNLLVIFVEDLELEEVDSLLE